MHSLRSFGRSIRTFLKNVVDVIWFIVKLVFWPLWWVWRAIDKLTD